MSQVFGYRIKQHEQQKTKNKKEEVVPQGAVPPYLLDREGQSRAKVLSNMIKQKRKEKAVSRTNRGSLLLSLPLPSLPSTLPSFLYPSISPSLSPSSLFPPPLSLSQGKWTVPLPKVRAVGEDEVFKVIRSGKRRSKIST